MTFATPFTATAVGLCALFSGGFLALQTEGPTGGMVRELMRWDQGILEGGDLYVDKDGHDGVPTDGLLGGALATWKSWSWGARCFNVSKALLLCLPILVLMWWYFGTSPPVMTGSFKVEVLRGKSLKIADSGSSCRVTLADKEYRTTTIHGGQDPVWSESNAQEWWVFEDVNVQKKSTRKVKIEVFNGDSLIGDAVLDMMDFAWFDGTSMRKSLKLLQKGKANGGEVEIQGLFEGSHK